MKLKLQKTSKKMRQWRKADWLILAFILVALLVRVALAYYPFFQFGYLVPPGGDPANHAAMAEAIHAGDFSFSYTWLFHLFVASVMKLFALSSLEALKLVTPALLALPALGVFFFLKNLFNRTSAVFGFVIALWATNYGLIAFGDGNYPNMIAAGLFLPLALVYFVRALLEGARKDYFLLCLWVVLVLFTHHLSAVFLLVAIVSFLVGLGLWQIREKIVASYLKFVAVFGALFVFAAAVLYFSPFWTVFSGAWRTFRETGAFRIDPAFSKIWPYHDYSWSIGPLVFSAGLFALVYLAKMLGDKTLERRQKLVLILILSWFAGLLICSRSEVFAFPGRFARELAFPLMLAMGIALSDIYRQITARKAKIIFAAFFALMVYVNLSQINGQLYSRPDYFNSMIWFDRADLAKVIKINRIASRGEIIATNEANPYLRYFLTPKPAVISSPLESTRQLERKLAELGADYVFVSRDFNGNHRRYMGEDYQRRVGAVGESLEVFAPKGSEVVAELDDDSVVYRVKSKERPED